MARDQERHRFRPVPLLIFQRWHAPPNPFEYSCWAAYRETEWRLLEARPRNHMSTHEVARMRRVSAVMLAHNLHVAGRRGEWAWEAACECLLARGGRWTKPQGRRGGRGAGGLRRGGSKRDPYPPCDAPLVSIRMMPQTHETAHTPAPQARGGEENLDAAGNF